MSKSGFKPYIIAVAAMMAASMLVLSAGVAAGQSISWARLFGTSFTDRALAVAVDRSSNLYVSGTTKGKIPGQSRSGGFTDAFLSKFDGDGKELWSRQFGTNGDDWARGVAIDQSGQVYVAGESSGDSSTNIMVSGIGRAYLRKFSPDGVEQWVRSFATEGSSGAEGVAVDRAGRVFVVGSVNGALAGHVGAGLSDGFIRLYDGSGQELWTRQFGTPGADFALDVAADGRGGAYVAGWTRSEVRLPDGSEVVSMDPFIRSYSSQGANTWSQRILTPGFAQATGVAADGHGSLYVAGWISGNLPGQASAGRTDAFIRKYGSDGSEVWTRQFGTKKEDRALGISLDSAGDPYVVGWTRGRFPRQTELEPHTAFARQDAFVRKYDQEGNALWTRQFGTKDPQAANSVALGKGGELFVAGETIGSLLGQTHLGEVDAFLVRLEVDIASPPQTAAPPAQHLEPTPTTTAQASPAPKATPLPGPTRQPSPSSTPPIPTPESTPAITTIPSSGGCTAPQAGGAAVGVEWLLAALVWPGLLPVARLSLARWLPKRLRSLNVFQRFRESSRHRTNCRR